MPALMVAPDVPCCWSFYRCCQIFCSPLEHTTDKRSSYRLLCPFEIIVQLKGMLVVELLRRYSRRVHLHCLDYILPWSQKNTKENPPGWLLLGCDYTWTQVRRKQEERSRITAAAKQSHQRKTSRELQLYRLQDHSFTIAFMIICHREQKQRHAGGLAGTCPCAMRRSQGATQKRRRFSEFKL